MTAPRSVKRSVAFYVETDHGWRHTKFTVIVRDGDRAVYKRFATEAEARAFEAEMREQS